MHPQLFPLHFSWVALLGGLLDLHQASVSLPQGLLAATSTQLQPFWSLALADQRCSRWLKKKKKKLLTQKRWEDNTLGRVNGEPSQWLAVTEAQSPCIQERQLHGAFHSPESHCGIRLRRESGCNYIFAQLVLLPYPPPLSLESSSSINHLPKNPQLRPCFQEPQSKKSISHSTAQTVVLLTNSSHVSAMTPGSSSQPRTTPVTCCSVQRPRLCPCFLSSSHVPDPIKTGWNPGPFAPMFAMLARGHTSPGATEYEVTIRD